MRRLNLLSTQSIKALQTSLVLSPTPTLILLLMFLKKQPQCQNTSIKDTLQPACLIERMLTSTSTQQSAIAHLFLLSDCSRRSSSSSSHHSWLPQIEKLANVIAFHTSAGITPAAYQHPFLSTVQEFVSSWSSSTDQLHHLVNYFTDRKSVV